MTATAYQSILAVASSPQHPYTEAVNTSIYFGYYFQTVHSIYEVVHTQFILMHTCLKKAVDKAKSVQRIRFVLGLNYMTVMRMLAQKLDTTASQMSQHQNCKTVLCPEDCGKDSMKLIRPYIGLFTAVEYINGH